MINIIYEWPQHWILPGRTVSPPKQSKAKIVNFNILDSRLKHSQSENDKIKSDSEIISFREFEKLSYFEDKGWYLVFWFSLFLKFELPIALTFLIYNQFWIAGYQNLG